MEYIIDVDELRRDMKEEYVAAMCCGFPMAACDLTDVEAADFRWRPVTLLMWNICRTGSWLNWLRKTEWI